MEKPVLKIGNKIYPSLVVGAPMAGVTDAPFRAVARLFGRELLFSEMALADSLARSHQRTQKMASISDSESPVAVQLVGHDPDMFVRAARKIEEEGTADFIDINMGCPVPKILKSGSGCALMDDEERAERIVQSVSAAVSLPVTVKFRLGRDSSHLNYTDFGKRMQDAGALAVTLHARTREMMYSGKADMEAVRRLKESLTIPVIANGDVRTPFDAARVLKESGADGVMIGRGALGRPWIFSECTDFLNGKKNREPKPLLTIVLEHLRLLEAYYGKQKSVFVARKHLAWYSSGIEGGAMFRTQVNKMTQAECVRDLVCRFFEGKTV